jgi:crotonobetaine/carnitine-CoA ligase
MAEAWLRDEQTTILELLERRLATDPDGTYLDVSGTTITARDVFDAAGAVAGGLSALGVAPGDRVATLMDTSVEALLAWFGAVRGGIVMVPINTAYKGDYLLHQLADSGSRAVIVDEAYLSRVEPLLAGLPDLEHVVVVGDRAAWQAPAGAAAVHGWADLLSAGEKAPDITARPTDLVTFIYTGGTTGPSKGCMVSHNYNVVLARQINISWRRTADDVAWVPLPLFHYNVYTTAIVGTLLSGGRAALYPRFSVSNFWPELTRTGSTIAVTLGSMAFLIANDERRSAEPKSGEPDANTSLRLFAAAPLPHEVDKRIRDRFGVETFSGAYGLTEASLVSWQPNGVPNKPNAAGIVNDEFFDVRIFDDDDVEMPRGTEGEIVIRPKRPNVMFDGYWGNPQATLDMTRNQWFHCGDIGRIDDDGYLFFVDRKKDYLRRRGENISSQQVEGILCKREEIVDVAVHAVPSEVLEDDLKITATLRDGATLTEEELFRWCIDELPYFAMPRYIEFRTDLPRSPIGRVLKRDLREQGVTAATWDSVAAGIRYDRR